MTPLSFLLLSRPPPRSSTGAAYPVFLFFPRNKKERGGKEKDGKGWEKGLLRVWSWNPQSTRSAEVSRCVVCHGVLRRVETSHAKRHKHVEIRGRFHTHTSDIRNTMYGTMDGTRVYSRNPLERCWKSSWTTHSLFLFIQISFRRCHSWHIEFSALPKRAS